MSPASTAERRRAAHPRPSGLTKTVVAARQGESGAVLILALVFITVIGTMAVGLLSFAFAGSRALSAYRLERTRRYAADSALQVAVHRLSQPANAALGVSPTPVQCARFPIPQDVTAGNLEDVVTANAYVTVWCSTTPNVPVDVIDLDGGQAPRDITMEVRCNTASGSTVTGTKLACGSGANATVIGKARVRFENDYAQPANARALVPKILSWQIRM